MSDDQSDFTNKLRRLKPVDPEGAAAPAQAKTRKEKAAPKTSKAKRVTSESADSGAKKTKAPGRAAKSVVLADEPNPVAVSGDEEKADVKAQRKAARTAKRSAKRGLPDSAPPTVAAGDDQKAGVKSKRKAARAAKRSAKKGQSDSSPPAVVQEKREKGKAKSERKAEKSAKKALPASAPAAASSDDEKTDKKAQRKAARAEKRSAKKGVSEVAAPLVAPPRGDEKAKAERKAAKAEKKAAKKNPPESVSAAVLSDDEKSDTKAKRKAARTAKRSAKKASPDAAAPLVAPLGDEEKAQAKAARKVEKAKKKSEKKSARGDGAEPGDAQQAAVKAERKAKKAEKKADRKNRKSDDGDDDAGGRETRISLAGFSADLASRIRERIESVLAASDASCRWAEPDGKSDVTVYAFEEPSAGAEQIGASIESIANDRARFRIFIGRAGLPASDGADPFGAENQAIAKLASTFEGAFVDVASQSRRYGAERVLENGALSDFGAELVATAILGIASSGRVAKSSLPRPQWPVPPDLAEARALDAASVLAQLTWSGPKVPRPLLMHATKESMEAFLDGKVAVTEEQSFDLKLPIAWPSELPTRTAEAQVLGLELLSGPLNYWYVKASGGSDAEIDALIKERSVSAGEILARAGKIIVDFADSHPPSHSAAWAESAVSRRAPVLALFVLCCKLATKRKVKFDEAVFLRVFNELLNLIEVLRASDFYKPGSFEGVQQDSLLAGLALSLRKTDYAERLLTESTERLKMLQLDVGLTADGVWRAGTFSDHCSLLTQFRTMIGDFGPNDTALKEPLAAAAKKMTVFAEALLKSDGSPPAFDDGRQKSYLKKIAGTRRALADAGFGKNAPAKGKPMARITDTYVFREGQYFASHTTRNPVPDSSLVILHREAPSVARDNPGGISLAFAHGAKDLLVGADPGEGTKRKDKAANFDASLRNGYQIDGVGYVPEQPFKPNSARLTKSWRGEGWAAAKSIDETNPAGSIIRTVVHLKAQHALIVVDELRTADGSEASFEQFWHVAPGLAAPDSTQTPLRFAGTENGNLTVAFDAQGTISSGPEGEGGTCVRRSLKLAKGVAASLFQWSETPADAVLKVLSAGDGDWSLEAIGSGFDALISLAGEELRYEPKAAP